MPIEYHQQHLEKFKNSLNDARILKLPETMTQMIQTKFEEVLWRNQLDELWHKITG